MTIDRLADLVRELGGDATPRELAELVWFAGRMAERQPAPAIPPPPRDPATPAGTSRPPESTPDEPVESGAAAPRGPDAPPAPPVDEVPDEPPMRSPPQEPTQTPLYPDPPRRDPGNAAEAGVPGAASLPGRLAVQRALRPLKRWVPTRRMDGIDERATARLIADQPFRRRIWLAVPRPALERWLDATLVIDSGRSMRIWRGLGRELAATLAECGVFRNVNTWQLGDDGRTRLYPWREGPDRDPAELIDPAGRRVILVFSDCVGPAWRTGAARSTIARWARHGPVVILQPLPERLWSRTAAPTVAGVLRTDVPGAPNVEVKFTPFDGREYPEDLVPVPVLELASPWVRRWARLVGHGAAQTAAVTFVGEQTEPLGAPAEPAAPAGSRHAAPARIRAFRAVASPTAYALARYIAMVQPSLPVMRLVHQAMFKTPQPAHLAEVVLSGLLRLEDVRAGRYSFVDNTDEALLDTVTINDANLVVGQVSALVEEWAGRSPAAFRALFPADDGEHAIPMEARRFALISEAARRRLKLHSIPSRPDDAPHDSRLVLVEAVGAGDKHASIRQAGVALGGRIVVTTGSAGRRWVSCRVRWRDRWHEAETVEDAGDVAVLRAVGADWPDDLPPTTLGRLPLPDVPVPDSVVETWVDNGAHVILLRGVAVPSGSAVSFQPAIAGAGALAGSPVLCGQLLVGLVAGRHDPRRLSIADAEQIADRTGHLLAQPRMRAVDYPGLFDVGRPVGHSLMAAEVGAVRFHARDREQTDLLGWATGDGAAVTVLTGPAGEGKTRLAVQLVERLRSEGWLAGLLARSEESTAFDRLGETRLPTLVAIDRADVQVSRARAVLAMAAQGSQGHRLRVLLLARSAGDWWRYLEERQVPGSDPVRMVSVGPLYPDPNTRRAVFGDAVADLAAALGHLPGERPGAWTAAAQRTVPPEAIEQRPFACALELQLLAFRALVDCRGPQGREHYDRATKYLVDRERSYWERTAVAVQLTASSLQVLRDCVVALALYGATSVSEANAVLVALTHIRDNNPAWAARAAAWLHETFPGGPEAYWGRFVPDSAAETIIAQSITSTPSLLTGPLPRVSADQARRAIMRVLRACDRYSTLAPLLAEAIASNVARLGPRLLDAIVVSDRLAGPSIDLQVALLRRPDLPAAFVVELIDRFESTDLLSRLDAEALERLAAALRASIVDTEPHHRLLAVVLLRLADERARAGRWADAVAAGTEAVQVLRPLGAHAVDLAAAMTELADRLLSAGEYRRAFEVGTQAVDAWRALPDQARSIRPALSDALDVLVHCALGVSDGGDPGAAVLIAAREQVDICRELADEQPVRHQARLAWASATMGEALRHAGAVESAVAAFDEAAAGLREAAAVRPSIAARRALFVLHRAGARLAGGKRSEAFQDINGSLTTLRGLARGEPSGDPARADPRRQLSLALRVSAQYLNDLGAVADCTRLVEEAVRVLHAVATEDTADHPAQAELREAYEQAGRVRAGTSNPAVTARLHAELRAAWRRSPAFRDQRVPAREAGSAATSP